MASGYTLTGLTAYVNENKNELFKKLILQGDTASLIRKQLGVKTKERLHIFDYEPHIQDGSSCGFNADGETKLSEREIEVKIHKVNDQWCDKDLLGYYAEYLVRIGANDNALPFEADIMDRMIRGIDKEMEKRIWVGNTADTGRTDLFNGFLTIAEGADSAATITATTASGANIYDMLIEGYKLVPEELIGKVRAFISPANFRALMLYLVENYKYNASLMTNETKEVVLPATDLIVRKTIGLIGVDNKVYIADPNNMVLGADMLSDMEDVRVWFSDDDDLWKAKVEWATGVQTIFPDEVIVVTKG